MVKKATKTVENGAVSIDFVNDSNLTVSLTDLPDEIKTRLACHGLSQKLGDSYAGAESVDDAYASACRVRDELLAGNWSAPRASGGGAIRTTLLAEALARVATVGLRSTNPNADEITVEQAREVLEEMDDDDKKSLRKDAGIQKVIAEIKLERATKEAESVPEGESMVGALFA